MNTYRQLTIWDVLDQISVAPPNSTLAPVWHCLDAELPDLSVEAQLETAAVAFNQIADILKSRAVMLLQDVRERNSPLGPIVSTDIFAGLVRTTMQLDLDDLIEPPIAQTFKPHGPHQFSNTGSQGDSVVAPVEKEKVLEMLEEVRTVEDVHKLAGDEDVHKWQTAIAYYLADIQNEISLPQLQRALKMPMVEVWLGLLLGGFNLEQRGDFYQNQNIWIIKNDSQNK
ncbi:hypothetical protein NIES37_70470 (plasmid) [Tolypothrix tenuis PCC 7101]|uniref:Uncharacterized protein n=1 Tax=Tolypothrix tenuis PCC 7101 TaxID=231146 RepID=A0A1Z4NBC8_9CYAN|nr:hypothetical protein [Aulosira sp. FACHB-113]BAZ03034.1 hypothetical protein NIES37_70470 [Tolypothrix tenuis PCC 7101]BAZ78228.1 hypothetical protein NIES50_68610 [Aulosira laxa NIES-50]